MSKTFRITTPYISGALVVVSRLRYVVDNSLCVLLSDSITDEPLCKASVHVDGFETGHENWFVCKNYSENEGLDHALHEAGIARFVGARIRVGANICPIMELLPEEEPTAQAGVMSAKLTPPRKETELRRVMKKRDKLSDEEFDDLLADVDDQIKECQENGDIFDHEECLHDDFGLEPDFVYDLQEELTEFRRRVYNV